MSKLIDETGNRHGALIVIRRAGSEKSGAVRWLCKCDCGNETVVCGGNLRSGQIKGCGCSNRKDELGKKFGKLTVIKFVDINRKRSVRWLCKCDCGKKTIVDGCRLRSGLTRSCGCLSGENKKLPEGIASKRKLFRDYKRRAKKRKLAWHITLKEFGILTKLQCNYCGADPSNTYSLIGGNGSYIYNGIDRVDNDKGYIPDNVVTCCGICNRAKMDMDYQSFLSWIKRVVYY